MAEVKALENPQYQWRTVPGVAKEVNLDPGKVLEVIANNRDKVVRSSVPSTSGEILYTTREHHRQHAPIFAKILGALKNRID